MSKELTEQFFNATLKTGTYYVLGQDGSIDIDYYGGDNFQWTVIKEVLAPVPTYDQFVNINKKVKELKQQLTEANKILFNVWDCREDREYYAELAKSYLEKYGAEK